MKVVLLLTYRNTLTAWLRHRFSGFCIFFLFILSMHMSYVHIETMMLLIKVSFCQKDLPFQKATFLLEAVSFRFFYVVGKFSILLDDDSSVFLLPSHDVLVYPEMFGQNSSESSAFYHLGSIFSLIMAIFHFTHHSIISPNALWSSHCDSWAEESTFCGCVVQILPVFSWNVYCVYCL